MKTRSQAGFALVEGLLSVIALALIAFVFFYVYNANKNTDKVVSQAAGSTSSAAKAPAPQRYLAIKELGVKVPLSSKLYGLEYSIAPADNMTADLSTKAFENAVAACKSPNTASSSFSTLTALTKVPGKYDASSPPQDVFSAFVAQFPDFYLTAGTPDGGFCNGTDQAKNNTVKTLFDQLSPALQTAIKNAKPI